MGSKLVFLILTLLILISSKGQHQQFVKFPYSDPCKSVGQNLHYDDAWVSLWRESDQWEFVINEEFNGNELNRDLWKTTFNWGPYIDAERYFYFTEDNVNVSDGKLTLSMKNDPGYYDLWVFGENQQITTEPKWYNYTSGMIQTKLPFQGGKFEIRCKLPDDLSRINPSFWLYGDCYQEIDVFEFLSEEDKDEISFNHHGMDIDPRGECLKENRCRDGISWKSDGLAGEWHTYSVEWTMHSITWKVDNIARRKIGRVIQGPHEIYNLDKPGDYIRSAPFPYLITPMYLIMSLGEHSGQDVIKNGTLPNPNRSMEVDYIRIYKQKQCHLDANVCNTSLIDEFKNHDRYKLVRNVNLSFSEDCHYQLAPKGSDYYYYSGEGNIFNNSTIHKGSTFELRPMSCSTDYIPKAKTLKSENSVLEESSISIYPNPSNKDVTITYNNEKISSVDLYNSKSELIHSYTSKVPRPIITLKDLDQVTVGLYYVKIKLSNGNVIFKKILRT